MFGGVSRTPASISNIPINGYIIFPNSNDSGKWYSKDFNGNVEPIGSLNSLIGSQRSYIEKSTTETTTGTTYVDYESLTVDNNDSVSAKHELIINFVWSFALASRDFLARMTVDGIQVGDEFLCEPKDPGSDQRIYTTFFRELDLSPGLHTIKLQYASGANGNLASIYSARMRSMRVE